MGGGLYSLAKSPETYTRIFLSRLSVAPPMVCFNALRPGGPPLKRRYRLNKDARVARLARRAGKPRHTRSIEARSNAAGLEKFGVFIFRAHDTLTCKFKPFLCALKMNNLF